MKNFRVALLTAAAFAACTVQHQAPESPAEQVKQAASAEPTLVTIGIDGQFSDWGQVLTNPLQVSVDGNGIDGNGCYPTQNSDRDCDDFTTQRDITTFAWTYDDDNVYTYVERPPSASTLTYSFIMDVDANGLVDGSDRVMQVEWKNGGAALQVRLYAYAPVNAGGDPVACPNTAACVAAGDAHAETDYIDGYDMPGGLGALLWSPPAPNPACTGSAAGDECGGDNLGTGGRRFETYVPWAQLGVPARSPIIWHVASSTNTQFSAANDNVGGPDGKAGLFGAFGVDFFPDRVGSANSPGSVDYCHTVRNTGDLPDRYNLRAVSNTGSRVQFFQADGACNVGAQIADDRNGDGDFTDASESGTGGDTNGDGLPDTGQILAGAQINLVLRITTPPGIIGATDVTIATARCVARPAVVEDVIDRTRIGPVTVQPDLSLSGTPGAAVDFGPFTVQNNTGLDTFDLFVRSSNGYPLQLHSDNAGAIGALLATDTNGDGTWDGATPNTGPLATSGTVRYWVRETIPGGAAINTVDSMRLIATSQTTPANTAAAQNTLRVLDALTITPSYTAPNGQLFGPSGSSVFLPHRVINSHGATQTVSLSQTGGPLGTWSIRWWSDPDGDGSIADGAQITSFSVGPFGGTMNLVTEILIPASAVAGDSRAAVTTVTGSIVGAASANDHVAVGNLQTYEDALFARPTRFFPACSTVYGRAVGLVPLQPSRYVLRYDDSLGAQAQANPMATNAAGVGSGSYALDATDAPGAWRLRVLDNGAPAAGYDLNPFTVEASGLVIASAPATAIDGPLPVSAQLTSTAQQSDYVGSTLTFELRDPSNALMTSTTVALVPIPFGSSTVEFALFPSVTYPVLGNYTVTAIWRLACAGNTSVTIASGSTTIARAPPAPALVSPANGATIGTSTPNLTGTAQPGATVNVTRDGNLVGTATADGSGNFSFASVTLSQGLHTWSATQTVGGATGPASPTFSFTVDTVAPAAPVVVNPPDGSRTNDTTPTIDGTAEANSSVAVSIGAAVVGTVTADGSGNWSYTLLAGQALAEGAHTATARATDAGGNLSPVSNANTFTVDISPPAPPTVTNPANGSVTSNTTPTVDGTTEPNAQVQVIVDGNVLATVTADASGNWAYTLTAGQALGNGAHTAAARATDVAGNLGPASAVNNFTVDTSVPPAPVVVTPPNGSRTNDTTPTISGTVSYSAASVEVFIGGVSVGVVPGPITGGTWSYTLTAGQALAEGTYSATARAFNLALTPSPISAANIFTVDLTPPAAPVVLTPADGSRTNDTTPTVSGTAEANASVAVFIGAGQVGTVTADAGGNWSYTLTAGQALAEGSYTATAQATDVAGNTGPATNPGNTFTVDLTAPGQPVITSPLNGARTNDDTPTITGTAEANSTVTVFIDGNPVGTVVADASGNWSYTLTAGQALVEGTYVATARATDVAGNQGSPSAGVSFTIDVTPPAAPVVVAPADGSRTNDTTPDVTGTAEADSTVQVLIDGNPVGTTTANGAGNWSFTVPTPLAEGSHTASARATDVAGNQGGLSNVNTFTVDVTPPAAPVVLTPADGSRTNDTTPDVTGTAEANSTVEVLIDGTPVGTATANAGGNWTFTVPTALAEGAHTVSARATDVAGNQSGLSNVNTFTVDTTPPAAPVVVAPADGSRTNDTTPTVSGTAEANAQVQVFIDGNLVGSVTADASGNWSYTLLSGQALSEGTYLVTARATDVAGNLGPLSAANSFTVDLTAPPAPVITSPADNALTNDTTPTVSGTAEPNATVTVIIDGNAVGTAVADGSGNWTFTVPGGSALGDGSHTITATATDVAGNTGPASGGTTITVDATPPSAPVVVTPADGSITNDNTPTITGTAEANATVQVFIGATAVATVVADASGNWTYTLSGAQALADGTYAATARATDPAGNVGPPSAANSFTVDTVAPAAPVVTAPVDGARTNDTTPTLSGTAEANSTVAVFIDGNQVGTVTADAQGNWTFTPTTPLAEGSHTATARATDAAGNTSPTSAGNGFTVDTTPPAAPVVVMPANGSTIADNTPTISGTSEANASVAVTVDGQVVGTVTADANGDWSYTLTAAQALTNASHTASAVATDQAGNVSAQSNTNTFTVDAEVPRAPVVLQPADGSLTNDATPTVRGTSEPGVTVQVTVDGQVVGTATADAQGNWSYTLTAAQQLNDGSHVVSAIATDVAGNASPRSNQNTFTVDATAPAAPVVATPAAGSASQDDTPTVTGTAEPGSSVQVFIDGVLVGTVTADAQGNWSYTLTTDQRLADGSHTASAVATDPAGNASQRSNENTFTVDATGPAAPVVTSPTEGSVTDDETPTITGTAEPGSSVQVFIDGTLVGTVTADAQGNWSLTPTTPLSEGSHVVTARATDALGNAGQASAPVTFTYDITPPIYGYRGGGCGCGTTDASATFAFGLLVLFAFARRRRRA